MILKTNPAKCKKRALKAIRDERPLTKKYKNCVWPLQYSSDGAWAMANSPLRGLSLEHSVTFFALSTPIDSQAQTTKY